MGITWKNVIDNTLQKLKEEITTPVFWDRDEVFRYGKEAIREVAETIKPFKRNYIIVVEAGKRKYEFPEEFIELNRVEFNKKRITPTSSEELDTVSSTWRNKTGEPEAYFLDQCLPGFFEVYKVPDTGGDEFVFNSDYGVVTGITSTGDTWTFNSEYGVITDITSTDDEWEFNSRYGVVTEILTPNNNLNVFFTGYSDEASSESDELPRPFKKSSRIIEDYCMWQSLSKEGEAQNLVKAAKYEGYWSRDLGQAGTKKDSRRREWRFDVEGVSSRVRKHPKLPDDYPDYEV